MSLDAYLTEHIHYVWVHVFTADDIDFFYR